MQFLTSADVRRGRKVIGCKGPIRGRILTPTSLSGTSVKIAEDGEWYPQAWIAPLAEEQIREELIRTMVDFVEGKSIINLKANGPGVEFILDDNTRVSLKYSSEGLLALGVIDALGNKVV